MAGQHQGPAALGRPSDSQGHSQGYGQLADHLLGRNIRPFAQYQSPLEYAWWYPSVFQSHKELAQQMVIAAGMDGYILELGSYIGNSATTFARAARRLGYNTTIVCMDTWLGDVNHWLWKGKSLGGQGLAGQPLLFEQFMANIAANNVSRWVLPVRLTASVGLQYLDRLIRLGKVPQPGVIYLDTAHTYPETLTEIELAWQLLPPGGFLLGDDFDKGWAPVQQSVNEFVRHLGMAAFDAPANYTQGWSKRTRRLVTLVDGDEAESVASARLMLELRAQWILRKACGGGPCPLVPAKRRRFVGPLRCCLNGWVDPIPSWARMPCQQQPDPACGHTSELKRHFFTRCKPSASYGRQQSCKGGADADFPEESLACNVVYGCRNPLLNVSVGQRCVSRCYVQH